VFVPVLESIAQYKSGEQDGEADDGAVQMVFHGEMVYRLKEQRNRL
jgi:hypothetical protein